MRIGILGTGTLATALGTVWRRAGHDVVLGGRSPAAVPLPEAARDRDAVLVAVPWQALREVLTAAAVPPGTPLIDPTNAVAHGVGELLVPDGRSIAEHVAEWAPGTHVVKAFHLLPADQWGQTQATVPLAGDDDHALTVTAELVRAAGANPVVYGPLRRARQLEETAGFVISLAFAGIDPASAVP